VKRQPWHSGTAPQKKGEELAEAIRWHRANAFHLRREAEGFAAQARQSNRKALQYESQVEDPGSRSLPAAILWNQRLSYSDSCCILWGDSCEDWGHCEFGEIIEGYWSAIPRRCRYDDEEEESAGELE